MLEARSGDGFRSGIATCTPDYLRGTKYLHRTLFSLPAVAPSHYFTFSVLDLSSSSSSFPFFPFFSFLTLFHSTRSANGKVMADRIKATRNTFTTASLYTLRTIFTIAWSPPTAFCTLVIKLVAPLPLTMDGSRSGKVCLRPCCSFCSKTFWQIAIDTAPPIDLASTARLIPAGTLSSGRTVWTATLH